ncbi:MAG: 2OG-Fe(II) oxygenase family protein [Pseudomonadota bacterium]
MTAVLDHLLARLGDDAVRSAFVEDRRARVSDAIPQVAASGWASELSQRQDWLMTMGVKGQTARVSPATLNSYPAEQRQQLERDLHSEASAGRGFFYDSIPVEEGTPGFLGDIYAVLSGPSVLAAMSKLCGSELTAVSAQATRYRPGQWLTRHRDDPQGESRQIAYVLSLTAGWHPDWGGLLQFFEDDGTPKDAWSPGLGSLSLFDVRHVHSVTYVAPYAAAPRLSVTGWFSTT